MLHINVVYELDYCPHITVLIEELPIYIDYETTMFVLNVTKDNGELLKQIAIPKDNESTHYHMQYTLTERTMECLSIIVYATAVSPYYGESMPAIASDIIFAGNNHSQK